jgi:hypothetical protein
VRANASTIFVVCAWFVVALSAVGCSPPGSKGTMPPPGPNGQVDASSAPDFIAVAGRDGGIVGYVPKGYLFPAPRTTVGQQVEPEWPVFAEDLRTLIGHMVPGKGFVALGVDPRTVPNVPVQQGPSFGAPSAESASLTLYVRNAVTQMAWFAVAGNSVGAQGYGEGMGIGCVNVGIGGQVVMVDRPPQDAGARTLRLIYRRGQATDQPTMWVDISADGAVTQGEGVPPWWSGAPQGC